MMVTAATPSSPDSSIITRLNKKVVTAATLAIQLRRSIGAAFSQYSDVKGRLSEPEPSPVSQKKDGSGGRGDEIANSVPRAIRRFPCELSHKHKVKQHIGRTGSPKEPCQVQAVPP